MATPNTATQTKHEIPLPPVVTGVQAEKAVDAAAGADLDDDGDSWDPATLLSAPPPRPGFSQRWIRSSAMGVDDVAHLMRKRNEKWEPRRPETLDAGFFAPVVKHASLGDVISNGDMILMERPLRFHNKQAEYVNNMTNRQTSAIEHYLAQNAPGRNGFGAGEVSEFDRKVTRGRKPKIADD